jgi:hypothetical protein
MRMKINKANATFTGQSPRHTRATTAGHSEGIKQELGGDIRAAKRGEGIAISETIIIKRGPNGN